MVDNIIPAGVISNEEKVIEQQMYISAQNKTILVLKKKIQDLEIKLKALSEDNQRAPANLLTGDVDPGVINPMLTCEIEISKLHKVTIERELTFEETKKLDLLIKNLVLLRSKKEAEPPAATKMSTEDLLKLAMTLGNPLSNEPTTK